MTQQKVQVRQIPIEQLVSGRFQPRQHFDESKLVELAEAIKTTQGLLQPIVVRLIDNDKYEIIAGERRWRAAMIAGLDTVMCLIRVSSDQEALEAAIIENISRTDLNPIEEAQAYQRLVDEFGYIHEEIAIAVGKSRVKVTNTLRILKLDARVQQFLIDGLLTEGHGKALAALSPKLQFDIAQKSVQQGWSVRKVELEVRRAQSATSKNTDKDINIKSLEKDLADHIGCRVKIDCENTRGKLEISFHNLEILDGLFARMGFHVKH